MHRAEWYLRSLFTATGRSSLAALTEADLIRWCRGDLDAQTTRHHRRGALANNTVRSRIALAMTFLRWCRRQHLTDLDPDDELRTLRRSFPATYGRQQAPTPAVWLTYDDAYGRLIAACQDGTWTGSRDQLVIRLGLLSLRASEVLALRWGNLAADGATITITGKRNHVRVVKAGPTLRQQLACWHRRYTQALGRTPAPDDPLVCNTLVRNNGRDPAAAEPWWGVPIRDTDTIRRIVHDRAARAGIPHLNPHDLRRTAAAILQRQRTPDGGHAFNLYDIQRVLGHASPETTQRYLDILDTEAIDTAAMVLD